MNNRALQIQNALRLVQFELDAMNQQNMNIQAYLSPVANEIIMSYIVQPYYNNILNHLINNNISYIEKCSQVERPGLVIVSYIIEFTVESLANLLL
jgi:hypothetical protein